MVTTPDSVPSPIRWAGSKRRLLPVLTRVLPRSFRRYIEPFAGSASLFFRLAPQCAILGDTNAELILTLRQLREHPRALHRRLSSMSPPHHRRYYHLRAALPEELDELDRAVRFLYLNRHCYNGVFRTNKLGHFNVPIGTDTGALPSLRTFVGCSDLLKRARLIAGDFVETLRFASPGDLVYLDPPYFSAGRKTYGEYGYGTFRDPHIERLIAEAHRLDDLGAFVLLSYRWSPTLRVALSKWKGSTFDVSRHVAGFATQRRPQRELLLMNYD